MVSLSIVFANSISPMMPYLLEQISRSSRRSNSSIIIAAGVSVTSKYGLSSGDVTGNPISFIRVSNSSVNVFLYFNLIHL